MHIDYANEMMILIKLWQMIYGSLNQLVKFHNQMNIIANERESICVDPSFVHKLLLSVARQQILKFGVIVASLLRNMFEMRITFL